MQKTFQKFMVPTETADSSREGGAQLSDAELYQLCCQFGASALEARRKFLGLLPEVDKRRLYEKHGFPSIFVFAAKLAGVSEEQVRRTLNLEERFRDKPVLRLQLVSGEVSVNKLARVAAVATTETADFWAQKTEVLTQSALETLVRDVRAHTNPQEFEQKSIFAPSLQLNEENLKRLLELQNKGIDINSLIAAALDERERAIVKEKEAIVAEQKESSSRYIPVRVKRVIEKEFGKKCAIRHCQKPAVNIHHTARLALGGGHDPNYLAPLCREHHQIAHAVDGKYWLARQR